VRRRTFIAAVAVTALPGAAGGAPPADIPVIAVLFIGKPDPALALLRSGLQQLGYVEGRNISLDVRSAEGDLERLPRLAAALVRRKPAIIIAFLTPAALAAKQATRDIPIVIAAADPVGTGLVASLARPGGNVTGFAAMVTELAGKQAELLKQAVPNLRRIAALCNAADPYSTRFREQVEAAGKALRIDIVPIELVDGSGLEAGFATAASRQAEAAIVQPSLPLALAADLALRRRLPAASPYWEFPRLGGFLAYGTPPGAGAARAAVFIDKILRGAKPADLPVEQPTKFALVINLKTAKALGLMIPQFLLAQADEVIE
jgi:ABC-type uncharacterized transport system substrate-binding protein